MLGQAPEPRQGYASRPKIKQCDRLRATGGLTVQDSRPGVLSVSHNTK
jgi:hypothetical protein